MRQDKSPPSPPSPAVVDPRSNFCRGKRKQSFLWRPHPSHALLIRGFPPPLPWCRAQISPGHKKLVGGDIGVWGKIAVA